MASSSIADSHIGMPNTWRMIIPPAKSVRASHEMSIVTMVYHARILRVESPKRSPMNSGSVEMPVPRYRGANTKASRAMNTKAYQA